MNNIENAISIFHHAVAEVNPAALIRSYVSVQQRDIIIAGNTIKLTPGSRLIVIGAGKAAALMAYTLEQILGNMITAGAVVTQYGCGLYLKTITLIEAGHPVPDAQSMYATSEILKLLINVTADDVVIFLLSGGASSLLADCPPGSGLTEVQQVYSLLLKCGADINEMNTVRKHISQIKGGWLAKKNYPAKLYSLILSDVTSDDPGVIGSGPAVADSTTFSDAFEILTKYQLVRKIPLSILQHIKSGCAGTIEDTPKPHDVIFSTTQNFIIGNNFMALQAAATKAESIGYKAFIIDKAFNGEAQVLGKMLATHAINYKGAVPACFLYGGESTVAVKGNGAGGRNQELALAAGIALVRHPHITILAAGTDGIDGPTDAAGAVVNAAIINTAIAQNINPATYLENNNSYNFFSQTPGIIKTGPTHTNVMDIAIVLIH